MQISDGQLERIFRILTKLIKACPDENIEEAQELSGELRELIDNEGLDSVGIAGRKAARTGDKNDLHNYMVLRQRQENQK